MSDQFINDFVSDICSILRITIPALSFNTSDFSTDTTLAQYDPNDHIIYIRTYTQPNPDQLFSIAHELRHAWQAENNFELFFSNYKTVNLCRSTDEYNMQLAELDANAFATIVMIDFFGLQSQYNGLSKIVITAIQNRVNEIIPQFS